MYDIPPIPVSAPVAQPAQASYQPPAPPSAPKKKNPVLAIVFGVVILVILALVALWYAGPLRTWYTQNILPIVSLQGARIITNDGARDTVQKMGIFGLSKVAVSKKTDATKGGALDYVEAGGKKVAVVLDADGKTQRVMVLGKKPTVLDTAYNSQTGLAVSAEVTHIAYAAVSFPTPNVATSTIDKWTIHLVEIETGKNESVGSGIAPQFFTRDGVEYLGYTTEKSFHVINLSNNQNVDVPLPGSDTVGFPIVISRDGMHLAYRNVVGKQYALFEVKNTNSFAVKPMTIFPPEVTSVAFGKDSTSIFVIMKSDETHTLSARAVTQPDLVRWSYALPAGFVRLIP